MSHSTKVIIIADQTIEILGTEVDIHDLKTITLDSEGEITNYSLFKRNREPDEDDLIVVIG